MPHRYYQLIKCDVYNPYFACTYMQITSAAAVTVLEFPFEGASQSVLSTAASDASGSISSGGDLSYRLFNVGLGSGALDAASATGQWGSHFRVVFAPSGTTSGLGLTWQVEGVPSNTIIPVTINNLDSDATSQATCAHLQIVKTPSSVPLGPSAISQLSTPFDTPFSVQAYNSLGVSSFLALRF